MNIHRRSIIKRFCDGQTGDTLIERRGARSTARVGVLVPGLFFWEVWGVVGDCVALVSVGISDNRMQAEIYAESYMCADMQ